MARARGRSVWPARLGSFFAGAATVYLLDPQRGAKRRARLAQKATHVARGLAGAAIVAGRDLRNRGAGLMAEARERLSPHPPVGDNVLAARVRARLGRVCSHPHAVEVLVQDGRVELRGDILASEHEDVVAALRIVRGVRGLDDHLAVHETAGHHPSLQGGTGPRVERGELMQEKWAPAIRLVGGIAGAGMLGRAFLRGGVRGFASGAVGSALLLRSFTNLPVARAVGAGGGWRAIDIQKDLHVNATPAEVFDFFRRLENFPRFMSHVRAVEPRGDNRWRWTVDGPGGVPVSWEAEITRLIDDQLLAWKSVEGSAIRNAGVVRFQPERDGTRIDIKLSYNPPGGALGHAFAALLGADPKRQIDDDLVRFKSLMEVGKATGRKEKVTRDELSRRPS